jgi:hypothetical protein
MIGPGVQIVVFVDISIAQNFCWSAAVKVVLMTPQSRDSWLWRGVSPAKR